MSLADAPFNIINVKIWQINDKIPNFLVKFYQKYVKVVLSCNWLSNDNDESRDD